MSWVIVLVLLYLRGGRGATNISATTIPATNMTAAPPTSSAVPSETTNTAIAIALGLIGGVVVVTLIVACCVGCGERTAVRGANRNEFIDIEGQLYQQQLRARHVDVHVTRSLAYDDSKVK